MNVHSICPADGDFSWSYENEASISEDVMKKRCNQNIVHLSIRTDGTMPS